MLEYNLNNQSIQIGDKFGLLEVIEYEGTLEQWFNAACDDETWMIDGVKLKCSDGWFDMDGNAIEDPTQTQE